MIYKAVSNADNQRMVRIENSERYSERYDAHHPNGVLTGISIRKAKEVVDTWLDNERILGEYTVETDWQVPTETRYFVEFHRATYYSGYVTAADEDEAREMVYDEGDDALSDLNVDYGDMEIVELYEDN